jgi:hypothetical protein
MKISSLPLTMHLASSKPASAARFEVMGVARILKGGSFSQNSLIFTVNFKDLFLCSGFSR